MPAGLAGPLSSMPAISAPRGGLMLSSRRSRRHLLNAHAKPAAAVSPNCCNWLDHRQRGLGGHRKADADRAAGRRDDRGVDADHFTFEVEQRATELPRLIEAVGLM